MSIWKTLGASNHTEKPRQMDDYYATDPKAAELLLDIEAFEGSIWEPACGECHLANVFESRGYQVRKSDIINRSGRDDVEVADFLLCQEKGLRCNIITNPPYKFAQQFVEKSMDIIEDGFKVAMFLKLTFMEGKGRKAMFEKFPPKTIWVSSSRLLCAKNGRFQEMIDGGGSAVAYAWYVWQKGYKGDSIVKWFN